MDNIPNNIKDKIIFDSIILFRNENGWNNIHKDLLKKYMYKTVSLVDLFSMDESGNYLDDICEISYW